MSKKPYTIQGNWKVFPGDVEFVECPFCGYSPAISVDDWICCEKCGDHEPGEVLDQLETED